MLADTAKALADGNRLRIIAALEKQELCVCQLTELLGLATSTVSRHIAVLRQAGILISRKQGRWVFYSLHGDCRPQVRSAVEWVLTHRRELPQAEQDHRRLQQILKTDPEELCRKQKTN